MNENIVNSVITRTCTIHYVDEIAKYPDLVLRLHIRKLMEDYKNQFEYHSYMEKVFIDETTPKMPGFAEKSIKAKKEDAQCFERKKRTR